MQRGGGGKVSTMSLKHTGTVTPLFPSSLARSTMKLRNNSSLHSVSIKPPIRPYSGLVSPIYPSSRGTSRVSPVPSNINSLNKALNASRNLQRNNLNSTPKSSRKNKLYKTIPSFGPPPFLCTIELSEEIREIYVDGLKLVYSKLKPELLSNSDINHKFAALYIFTKNLLNDYDKNQTISKPYYRYLLHQLDLVFSYYENIVKIHNPNYKFREMIRFIIDDYNESIEHLNNSESYSFPSSIVTKKIKEKNIKITKNLFLDIIDILTFIKANK